MNLNLPPNLESTRSLLAGSLQMHATEQAPAVPADLLSDLTRRFNNAPPATATIQPRSWFEAIQSFITRPMFGMATLAIAILGISVPHLIDSASTRSAGGFRGTVSPTPETRNIRIILIQSPTGFQQALANVGDLEGDMISSSTNNESITGQRILVDFATATITAVNASDEKIHTAPLPKDVEEISAAIATAVSRL